MDAAPPIQSANDLTHTEEHYLKVIYLQSEKQRPVPVKAVALALGTRGATVSEMLRRLEQKGLLGYQPYRGVELNPVGQRCALQTLRRQRLWEVFLVEKLGMDWAEVHAATEELEHVRSEQVMERLEHYLGYPKWDPHGDPIPDRQGRVQARRALPLSDLTVGRRAVFSGVTLHEPAFLQQLDRLGLTLGCSLQLEEIWRFDNTRVVRLLAPAPGEAADPTQQQAPLLQLSMQLAAHMLVKPQQDE